MLNTLNYLDQQLMLWLNHDGGAFQDQLWWILSGKLTWLPLYLFLLWVIYGQCRPIGQQWKHLVLCVVTIALVVTLADQISSGLIKPWAQRPRPAQPDSGIAEWIHIVGGYRGGHYGFVSSHAANTWGVSLWFILLLRGWRREGRDFRPMWIPRILPPLLVAFTALNCYSRIYLGVHYPGDILGGLIVGTGVAYFCHNVIYQRTKKRMNIGQ